MGNKQTFGDIAQQATSTVEQALGDLRVLVAAAEQAQSTMKAAMLEAQRSADLSLFDPELLNHSPYAAKRMG
jgi:hypothetical protein